MSRSARNKSDSTMRGGSAAPAGGGAISLLDHEETFLLIKPDASTSHQQILQHVADTGLQLTMQSFTITQEQADIIVHMYPSVSAAAEAARVSGRSRSASMMPGGGLSSTADVDGIASSSSRGAGDAASPDATAGSRAGSMRVGPPRRPESHNGIMNDILRLARRGGAGDVDGRRTGRGATSNDGDGAPEEGGDGSGAATASSQSGRPRGLLLKSANGVGGVTVGGDYRSLLQQHVKHLVGGGTSLAMIIAGPNAISTIAALVGPEDPDEARYSAPKSLRARFGRDVVHNAVFCTTAASDVLTLVRSIFAVEGRRAAAGEGGARGLRRGGAGQGGPLQRGPDLSAGSWMDHTSHPRSDGGSRLRLEHHRASLSVRPPEDAVSPFDAAEELTEVAVEEVVGGGGLGMDSLLDLGSGGGGPVGGLRERGIRRDRMSSAGEHFHGHHHQRQAGGGDEEGGKEQSGVGGSSAAGGLGSSRGGGGGNQATSELARMLADERRKLIRQSKALRVREMDLLLREQDLFRTAANTSSGAGALISPRSDGGSVRDMLCTSSSSLVVPPATLSATLPRSGGGLPPSALHDGGPASDDDDTTTNTTTIIRVPAGPYVVKEDLESLVENPRRVGYLFHKLDGKHAGVITREVFLQFYLRSECLHVIGQEDPIRYVTRLLDRQHVPSDFMSLEHFTVALMRLLQL